MLAAAGVLAMAGLANADTSRVDGDLATTAFENIVSVGPVGPSATVTVDVAFAVTCAGTSHVDAGQTVTFSLDSEQHMGDGAVLDVPDAVVGPMPSDWTVDTEGCADTTRTVLSAPVQIKLKAPSTPGDDYQYDLMFRRSLSTGGNNDATAFSRTPPALTILVDVVANTPPVLHLPADMTVEGDTTGGWTAAYTASASDTEDAPDPEPTCTPAVGEVLGLGTTTIACSVVDSGGLGDAGSFDVTVEDTTAPDIASHADVHVTTSDAGGRAVTFSTPAADDVVDASPSVGCAPASGSVFPVGTTSVTCTATDASGNHASTSFDVVVDLVVPHTRQRELGRAGRQRGDVPGQPGPDDPVQGVALDRRSDPHQRGCPPRLRAMWFDHRRAHVGHELQRWPLERLGRHVAAGRTLLRRGGQHRWSRRRPCRGDAERGRSGEGRQAQEVVTTVSMPHMA